jgi:hypothetical protein
MLSVPVTLSGKNADGPFDEAAQTMVVSAHGALIGMKARVSNGQLLRIRTVMSPEEQDCKVIWVGPATEGSTQCGIEFVQHGACRVADLDPLSEPPGHLVPLFHHGKYGALTSGISTRRATPSRSLTGLRRGGRSGV